MKSQTSYALTGKGSMNLCDRRRFLLSVSGRGSIVSNRRLLPRGWPTAEIQMEVTEMHMTIKINEKFKKLLPELTPTEYQELESAILEQGCISPLILWDGQIIDGHNRFGICEKNGVLYETRELTFADEEEALTWMLRNQLGRRNLTANQKTLYIGQLYNSRKRNVGGQTGNQNAGKNVDSAGPDASTENESVTLTISFSDDPPIDTARAIAEETKVSPSTVVRAAKVADAFDKLDPDNQKEFLAGKITSKSIVKKVTPPEAPALKKTEFAPGKSIGTEVMESQARRFSRLIEDFTRKTKEIIHTGTEAVRKIPQPLAEFVASIEKTCITLRLDLHPLKQQYICEECLGTTCEGCIGGFVDDPKREFQLSKIKKDPNFRGRKNKKASAEEAAETNITITF